MKNTRKLTFSLLMLGATAILAGCSSSGGTSKSLRTQLEAPSDLTFNWEAGTFSFKAVEHATYYRAYFYNIGSPDDDIGNTEYFKSHTEEETETYPDGQSSTKTVTVYDTDDNGNYILKDQEEILAMSPTFSKRFAANYIDANGDRQNYQAGETVTFTLPNESVGGGTYYIGVKSGGPISLYSTSEMLLANGKVKAIMHCIDPEMTIDYSNTFNQYGTKESTTQMGPMTMTSNTQDKDNEVLDGTGMMLEIANADSFYNANPNSSFSYSIKDAEGKAVTFTYTNIKMKRNDSNTFCGWEKVEKKENVTTGTASVSHYIYSHSGPTMEYQTSGFFYINGLTTGSKYTLTIKALGDNGETSYDSESVDYEFTAAVTPWTAEYSAGGGGGFPGGGGGGGAPSGPTEGGDTPAGPTEGGDTGSSDTPAA